MEVAQWYDRQMKARPLFTKALSSSFLAACSCAVAQALRRRASLRELASFTLQAAPPFGHLWFELLEAKLGPGRILLKTLVDQALFRPVMLFYGFVLGGLLSGKTRAEVRRNVRENLVQVLVASWKVWPAAVLFTHRFIPRLYQSTFTDVLAFFWDAAWLPSTLSLSARCTVYLLQGLRELDDQLLRWKSAGISWKSHKWSLGGLLVFVAIMQMADTCLFVSRPGPGAPPPLPLRRAVVLAPLLGAAALSGSAPAIAAANKASLKADQEKLIAGYKDLVYMMQNFNKVTRKCDKNQDKISQPLQTGFAGPDSCLAQPLQVRKYLGQTSIKANLFDTKQMLVNFELAGMVPSGLDDEYGDLVEDFERYKREADEWAYSSSWAEARIGRIDAASADGWGIGKAARKLLAKHTTIKAGETFLLLEVRGAERLIRIKDSHTYLGTIIAYQGRKGPQPQPQNLGRPGQVSTDTEGLEWERSHQYQAQTAPLAGMHSSLPALLPGSHRMYSGWPAAPQDSDHTRTPTSEVWAQARLPPPETALLLRLRHLCQRRDPAIAQHGPDLVSNDGVALQLASLLSRLEGQLQTMQTQAHQSEQELHNSEVFACQHCDQTFPTAHARVIHHSIKHPDLDPPEDMRQRPVFSAPDHAPAHLPIADTVGTELTTDSATAGSATVPKEDLSIPLVRQSSFLDNLHNWERLLDDRSVKMTDLEAEIFAHCMPSGAQAIMQLPDSSNLPNKRQRPEQGKPFGRMMGRQGYRQPQPSYTAHPFQQPHVASTPFGAQQPQDGHLRLLSKIVLKQEEQLSLLRKDTQFVLFLRQDDKSILPALMAASKEWKAKQEAGENLQSSQRTVLLNCLLRELLARVQRVVATAPGRESLKKAEWLKDENLWSYLRWAPKQKRLVVDDSKEPLLHDEAVRILSELQKSITGDIVTKFNSTVNLARLEEEGSGATEVHEQLCKLVGSSITNLAAFSMRKTTSYAHHRRNSWLS
ncbi:unnamed protein product [Symbiodinium sp. CCMP2592]|nr:unnamed protein product [Symbiodinium sp. CCMP2592]